MYDRTAVQMGPISWFNLGVSGVLMGCGLAFYYYARYCGCAPKGSVPKKKIKM